MGWYDNMQRAHADVTITPISDPTHPFWYGDAASYSSTFAGFPMGPETATRVSTVFACVSLKAETVGGLPLHLYRRTGKDGEERERAKDHRLYATVRRTPNAQHSPMDFFSSLETRVNLRGAALSWIQERRDGVHLIPIPARDVLKVEQLDTGALRFEIRDPQTGKPRTLSQGEAFYVRDLMEDGFNAYARAALAREAIAVAAAMEAAVGGFFKNNMTSRVLFKNTQFADEKKRKEFREMLRENYSGWRNASEAMVLWGGMDAQELGKVDEAALFTDPRKNQVAEIARYFGRIPLFMIGLEEKSTTWGTGIEQQTQAWINYGMLPSLARIEQAANRDLLFPEEREEFFFEFNLDGLLRGDSKQRAETMAIKHDHGVVSANDWRLTDNMPRRTDPGGDEYRDSPPGAAANVQPGSEGRESKMQDDDGEDALARIVPAPLVSDVTDRLVGVECGALRRRAGKAQENLEKWAVWLAAYYGEHRARVREVVTPIAASFGLASWTVDQIATRIERTAILALPDGVSEAWLAGRRAEVLCIVDETFRAGAAVRRAA